MLTVGSKRQVFNGTAKHTSGGLTKADLMLNKNGKVVSKAKHMAAKRNNNLGKHLKGKGSGIFSSALGAIGLGLRKRRRVAKKPRKVQRGRKQKGSGWFDDFSKGFMLPINAAAKLAPIAMSL